MAAAYLSSCTGTYQGCWLDYKGNLCLGSFTARLRIVNTPVSLTLKEFVLHLRSATSADLCLLRHWDEQPHVIASDPNDDWDWEVELDRTPDWREQLIAEIDGRPIGFIQIIDPAREESHYWGDVPADLRAIDIWIGEESDLGKGYGTQMMQLALARCFADPAVTAVLVDPLTSNTRAHRFYERLGFQFIEQRRFVSPGASRLAPRKRARSKE